MEDLQEVNSWQRFETVLIDPLEVLPHPFEGIGTLAYVGQHDMALDEPDVVVRRELDFVGARPLDYDTVLGPLIEGEPVLYPRGYLAIDRMPTEAVLQLQDEPPLEGRNQVVVDD